MDSALTAVRFFGAIVLISAGSLAFALLLSSVFRYRHKRQMKKVQEDWNHDPLNYH